MAAECNGPWDDVLKQPESAPLVPATPGALVRVSPMPEGSAIENQAAPRVQASALQILVFLKALRFCWGRAFAVAVPLAFLVGVTAYRVLPPSSYTTQALLHVSVQPPKVLFAVDIGEDFGSFQRTQVQIIHSRFVLDAVLQDPKVADLHMIQSRRYPRDWLQKQLEADFSIGPEILRIALTGDNPQELAVLVNAVVDTYLLQYVQLEDNRRRERMELLRKYQEEWEGDLQRRRAELKKLAGDLNDPGMAALKRHFDEQRLAAEEKELLQYGSELRRVNNELETQRRREKELADVPVPAPVIQDEMDRDPVLAKLVTRAAEIRALMTGPRAARDLAINEKEQKARREELRPRIIQREREKAERAYHEKSAQLKEQAESLKTLEKLLRNRVERLVQEIDAIPRAVVDLEPLREKIARVEFLTKKAADEVEALKLADRVPPRIIRMEAAEPPRINEGKGRFYKPLLAACATFGLVLFAFSWLEVRAAKVATADDVSSGAGLRIVGALPVSAGRVRHRSVGLKTAREVYQDDLLTASVDATCTVLLHLANQEMLRVLMVTSAVLGEGKTTLASHLALSLARAGRRTLLVDGDLRRPGLARLFNVPAEPGLREFLCGQATIEQMVRLTELPRLALIPTGPWDGSTLEVLAQERIPALFESLKSDYDFIIVDSAPVLGVADSLLIARHVNAVLFSVLRGVSRVPLVCAAQERLAMVGVRTLGAVVNGVGFEAYYGGYRYAAHRE